MNELISAALSFVLCLLFVKTWILISRNIPVAQAIRDEGPKEHLEKKRNIPTMGGLAFLLAVPLATFAYWSKSSWVILGAFVSCGLLGLADDGLKVFRGKNLGLKARHKILGQLIIGIGLAYALQATGTGSVFHIPLLGNWDSGRWFYPFVAFTLMACTNAVNLTDGLDGLAAGVSGIVAFFIFMASLFSFPSPATAVISAALIGSLAAFLWFNQYPARVFMGDVGSLALGGILCALAFQTRLVFWLPVAGGILVAETLSVIMQVIYFKLSGGKRIFKMSPLHHHYELSGIPETQVTLRFWIVSVFLAWLSIVGAVNGF